MSTLYEGKYLRLVKEGRWEWVERVNATGVIAVVAVTDDGEMLLIEQERPAIRAVEIDVPAGLAGDTSAEDSLLAAAKRELEEETGYAARRWKFLAHTVPTAGLTDEVVSFFRASGLRRVTEGGGVDGEDIRTHLVPLEKVDAWLARRSKRGAMVGMKVFAALHFARQEWEW